jgi:hypothetical protein
VAVVSVLSERERRVLAAAEASLLEHDEALVRSFDALARNDGGASPGGHPPPIQAPAPRASEPERPAAPEPRRRSAPMYDGLLRTLLVLGLIGMLAVSGWIFYAGDGQIRLLTGLVMFPVLALTVFTVVVLHRREDPDGS